MEFVLDEFLLHGIEHLDQGFEVEVTTSTARAIVPVTVRMPSFQRPPLATGCRALHSSV